MTSRCRRWRPRPCFARPESSWISPRFRPWSSGRRAGRRRSKLAAISCVQRPGLAGHLEQLSRRRPPGGRLRPGRAPRSTAARNGPLSDAHLRARPAVWSTVRRGAGVRTLGRGALRLAGANVPLRPMDARHECWRLHGLVREMLQAELRRSEPELATRLHRRASDWCGRAGDLDRAIDHARRAEDLDRTAALLWPNLPAYLGEGRQPMVGRWLTGVTPERAAGWYLWLSCQPSVSWHRATWPSGSSGLGRRR